MASRYHEVYESWKKDPLSFWGEAAKEIDWIKPPKTVFDPQAGVYGRWFPDGTLNTCYNALDRHVINGRADQAALIYDSPVDGPQAHLYLCPVAGRSECGGFGAEGFRRGQGRPRAGLYADDRRGGDGVLPAPASAPSIPWCSAVSPPRSWRPASTISQPKVILTASCGIETNRDRQIQAFARRSDRAGRRQAGKVLLIQRPQEQATMVPGRDFDWGDLVVAALAERRKVEPEEMLATDPLYILYTSGTTGIPKGVVRDNGGHAVALKWTMKNLYGIEPGEVFWAASDVGWVVGHSYIIYAQLLHGATTVVYEGKPIGTPDPGAFWRMIEEHNIVALFTAPTAFRAVRKEDPNAEYLKKYNVGKSLRTLFLAGERADPDTVAWAEQILGVPVIDHWWQTETGWAIAGNPVGLGALPVKHGSPTVAMPGYDVQIVDEGCHPVDAGKMGSIVIKLPLPPGCLPTLWKQDARMTESYLIDFPGYYKTADAGFVDPEGYLYIMGRTDDIINVAGHRLSTGGMEEVLASHPDVAECAVIGMKDELKGEQPCGFVVLKSGVTRSPIDIEKDLVKLVRDKIGPVAAFKIAITVARLPKTRSGKILRGTMKKIADGDNWTMPATIDDPAIMEEIMAALQHKGV